MKIQLGSQKEGFSAQNFGLSRLYQVIPNNTSLASASGTLFDVTLRNPGTLNTRGSVNALRLRTTVGTTFTVQIAAGTVTVELLGIGE